MQWLLNSDQSYVFCYQMLHNWPATSASYFIIHQINQFDQFLNLTRFQFCRANSTLSTAATILSYLTKVPLVSVTWPFILSIIFTFPYKVKFERNSLMIFIKIGSLPQERGKKDGFKLNFTCLRSQECCLCSSRSRPCWVSCTECWTSNQLPRLLNALSEYFIFKIRNWRSTYIVITKFLQV